MPPTNKTKKRYRLGSKVTLLPPTGNPNASCSWENNTRLCASFSQSRHPGVFAASAARMYLSSKMQQCRVHSGQWFTRVNKSMRNFTNVGGVVGAELHVSVVVVVVVVVVPVATAGANEVVVE